MEEELRYLGEVNKEIKNKTSLISSDLLKKLESNKDFKKYLWENKQGMDKEEIEFARRESDVDLKLLSITNEYIKKLLRAKDSPYFGRIDFKEKQKTKKIYVGLTYIENEKDHLVYDWRAPISNMFYDFGVGEAFYQAPTGKINGEITTRRQFKIENGKLVSMFDNSINIVDEVLQEVLATDSKDKMKNIVNTIQQEQNAIIRNVDDRNLIVQGIAGSGKTSVALHRIAFLLYKLENLSSNNILVFSPNNVFSEYISNVLPELGEENTIMTTFSDLGISYIRGYEKIESFTNFLQRFYKNEEKNKDLVKFKLSDGFKNIIDNYVKNLEKKVEFQSDIETEDKLFTKEELNEMYQKRYSSLPLIERLLSISSNLSNFNQINNKKKYYKKIKESINISVNYKELYFDLYKSGEFNKHFVLSDREIKSFVNRKILNYEDSILFIYMMCLLEGFMYNPNIKQVVVDEAQDYTYLQYFMIKKIFKKASFTILGDVNQTINPYYKYESLETIKSIFSKSVRYETLNKTYRSSKEIIDYTNKILNLDYISAIRKSVNIEVVKKIEKNLKDQLKSDIVSLQNKYKSIAIITKTDDEGDYIYELLKDDFKDLMLLKPESENFKRDLVIVSSYSSKGLEFDSVISYNKLENKYKESEKNLYYVVCTRAQHELIIYN